MSDNYEPIKTTTNSNMQWRNIVALILIAFIGGTVAAGWLITKYDLFQTDRNQPIIKKPATVTSVTAIPIAAQNPSTKIQTPSNHNSPIVDNVAAQELNKKNDDVNDALINERVDSLDDRLSRINAQAQRASGNTDRTEAMLIAFAARRAIDSGATLGYVETQLRSRFSNANAEEVNSIIDAGKNPIRLATLQNELDTNSDSLLTPNGDADIGSVIKKEMNELFVIRKAGSQPPQPKRRLARINTALANRDITTAVAEMEKMPGVDSAKDWIKLAKRYIKVQNALDTIEKFAISMPNNPQYDILNTQVQNSDKPNN